MQKRIAGLIIGICAIGFLVAMIIGLWQSGMNPTLDKIPVEVQVIYFDEPSNCFSFDGRPRSFDLSDRKENKRYTYYKVLYRGELNNGETVEFWDWVEYEEYIEAMEYLNAA